MFLRGIGQQAENWFQTCVLYLSWMNYSCSSVVLRFMVVSDILSNMKWFAEKLLCFSLPPAHQ